MKLSYAAHLGMKLAHAAYLGFKPAIQLSSRGTRISNELFEICLESKPQSKENRFEIDHNLSLNQRIVLKKS